MKTETVHPEIARLAVERGVLLLPITQMVCSCENIPYLILIAPENQCDECTLPTPPYQPGDTVRLFVQGTNKWGTVAEGMEYDGIHDFGPVVSVEAVIWGEWLKTLESAVQVRDAVCAAEQAHPGMIGPKWWWIIRDGRAKWPNPASDRDDA